MDTPLPISSFLNGSSLSLYDPFYDIPEISEGTSTSLPNQILFPPHPASFSASRLASLPPHNQPFSAPTSPVDEDCQVPSHPQLLLSLSQESSQSKLETNERYFPDEKVSCSGEGSSHIIHEIMQTLHDKDQRLRDIEKQYQSLQDALDKANSRLKSEASRRMEVEKENHQLKEELVNAQEREKKLIQEHQIELEHKIRQSLSAQQEMYTNQLMDILSTAPSFLPTKIPHQLISPQSSTNEEPSRELSNSRYEMMTMDSQRQEALKAIRHYVFSPIPVLPDSSSVPVDEKCTTFLHKSPSSGPSGGAVVMDSTISVDKEGISLRWIGNEIHRMIRYLQALMYSLNVPNIASASFLAAKNDKTFVSENINIETLVAFLWVWLEELQKHWIRWEEKQRYWKENYHFFHSKLKRFKREGKCSFLQDFIPFISMWNIVTSVGCSVLAHSSPHFSFSSSLSLSQRHQMIFHLFQEVLIQLETVQRGSIEYSSFATGVRYFMAWNRKHYALLLSSGTSDNSDPVRTSLTTPVSSFFVAPFQEKLIKGSVNSHEAMVENCVDSSSHSAGERKSSQKKSPMFVNKPGTENSLALKRLKARFTAQQTAHQYIIRRLASTSRQLDSMKRYGKEWFRQWREKYQSMTKAEFQKKIHQVIADTIAHLISPLQISSLLLRTGDSTAPPRWDSSIWITERQAECEKIYSQLHLPLPLPSERAESSESLASFMESHSLGYAREQHANSEEEQIRTILLNEFHSYLLTELWKIWETFLKRQSKIWEDSWREKWHITLTPSTAAHELKEAPDQDIPIIHEFPYSTSCKLDWSSISSLTNENETSTPL